MDKLLLSDDNINMLSSNFSRAVHLRDDPRKTDAIRQFIKKNIIKVYKNYPPVKGAPPQTIVQNINRKVLEQSVHMFKERESSKKQHNKYQPTDMGRMRMDRDQQMNNHQIGHPGTFPRPQQTSITTEPRDNNQMGNFTESSSGGNNFASFDNNPNYQYGQFISATGEIQNGFHDKRDSTDNTGKGRGSLDQEFERRRMEYGGMMPMMNNPMMGNQMMGNQTMGNQMMNNPMMGNQMMGNQMMNNPMMGNPMMNRQQHSQDLPDFLKPQQTSVRQDRVDTSMMGNHMNNDMSMLNQQLMNQMGNNMGATMGNNDTSFDFGAFNSMSGGDGGGVGFDEGFINNPITAGINQQGNNMNNQQGNHMNQQQMNPQMGNQMGPQMGNHPGNYMNNHMGQHMNNQQGNHMGQQMSQSMGQQMGNHMNQSMGQPLNQQMGNHMNQSMSHPMNQQMGQYMNNQHMGNNMGPQMMNQNIGPNDTSKMNPNDVKSRLASMLDDRNSVSVQRGKFDPSRSVYQQGNQNFTLGGREGKIKDIANKIDNSKRRIASTFGIDEHTIKHMTADQIESYINSIVSGKKYIPDNKSNDKQHDKPVKKETRGKMDKSELLEMFKQQYAEHLKSKQQVADIEHTDIANHKGSKEQHNTRKSYNNLETPEVSDEEVIPRNVQAVSRNTYNTHTYNINCEEINEDPIYYNDYMYEFAKPINDIAAITLSRLDFNMQKIKIDKSNNKLDFMLLGDTDWTAIEFEDGDYTSVELLDAINQAFEQNDIYLNIIIQNANTIITNTDRKTFKLKNHRNSILRLFGYTKSLYENRPTFTSDNKPDISGKIDIYIANLDDATPFGTIDPSDDTQVITRDYKPKISKLEFVIFQFKHHNTNNLVDFHGDTHKFDIQIKATK